MDVRIVQHYVFDIVNNSFAFSIMLTYHSRRNPLLSSEEQSRIMAAPVGQTLRRLENKRKPDAEDEEQRKRQKRESESKEPGHQTKFIPSRETQIQKLKEAESMTTKVGPTECPSG
jgi:hypothetical protein